MKKFALVLGVCSLALVLILSSGCGKAKSTIIQIKGSDTLINLVQKLSESYMAANPGQQIAVTGGGSGTGIASLINNECDVANASRAMSDSEIKQAEAKGINPKAVNIAIDGLSIITNASNPVKQLTVEQLGKIFKGEITNWKQVGGKDGSITLYGRQSNSGTFVFFREHVLKGDYSQNMRQMNGNSQIVESVKQDPTGVSYVGVSYAKNATGINVLSIAQTEKDTYFSPLNSADVKSGKYPISRPLNQYVNGKASVAVQKFIDFELSVAGQKIVEEEGFVTIK